MELQDTLTKQIFLEEFNDIKDEYLKSYKEAIKQKESASFSIVKKNNEITNSGYREKKSNHHY